MLLSVMAINFWLYSRGMSFGTFLAGFRLRTRKKQPRGKAYGLVLTMISFASIPAIALMVYLSFDGEGVQAVPWTYRESRIAIPSWQNESIDAAG